jgi:hypothetical protein
MLSSCQAALKLGRYSSLMPNNLYYDKIMIRKNALDSLI